MHSLSKFKKPSAGKVRNSGFTLVEIAIALALIVVISVIGIAVGTTFSDYEAGVQAGEKLNIVLQAEREYATDHPNVFYIDPTDSTFLSYLPGGVLPTLPNYQGNPVGISLGPVGSTNTDVAPVAVFPGNVKPPDDDGTNGLWNCGPT